MSDQQILDLIRNGHSHKALATLYNHYPMIRRFVRHEDMERLRSRITHVIFPCLGSYESGR